ncbi:RidA family protein [Actinoalloteichus hymeniacidonis]|uniref:Translation initiation inhibitor, yjgF family n=1 Tax=Actinoalloteichus hymeniacidonis TaxID=340345 RepID=A0AAC9HQ73_9PSEU|nr:RidA family protein [Actinoalloteichus hymeniacidonis]AOS63348.1 putative translation initiation inhibitor, yjgF family [Actinoalloteichus hymeniacidonis]MBB5908612.1 enamine deaminase RidA (YjgF/YER057c/UK114 family) [Actinoalloteichus hymeniacidonis]
MTITLVNPSGLIESDIYHQMSIASGSKLVFIAGQVSWDAEGTAIAEGDLAGQVEQCYANVARALDEAGATFDDVAKLTMYVVNLHRDMMPVLLEGIRRAGVRLGRTPVPPISVLGVMGLDVPEHLVELEATAVLD